MYDGGSRVDRGRGGMLRPSAGHSGRSTGLCIQPANREAHLSVVDPDEDARYSVDGFPHCAHHIDRTRKGDVT